VLSNMQNPVWFICGMIGALENVTSPETGKLCAQYLGPGLRLANFNLLPFPVNPFLSSNPPPYMLRYSEPSLMPGASGPAPGPPDLPPAVSAYTGMGDVPPPLGYGPPPGPPPPAAAAPPGPPTLQDMLLPAEKPPPPPSDGTPP
jgi:phospholipid/cholesterol/gamma-HCH transport system substrate-binding protein